MSGPVEIYAALSPREKTFVSREAVVAVLNAQDRLRFEAERKSAGSVFKTMFPPSGGFATGGYVESKDLAVEPPLIGETIVPRPLAARWKDCSHPLVGKRNVCESCGERVVFRADMSEGIGWITQARAKEIYAFDGARNDTPPGDPDAVVTVVITPALSTINDEPLNEWLASRCRDQELTCIHGAVVAAMDNAVESNKGVEQ